MLGNQNESYYTFSLRDVPDASHDFPPFHIRSVQRVCLMRVFVW